MLKKKSEKNNEDEQSQKEEKGNEPTSQQEVITTSVKEEPVKKIDSNELKELVEKNIKWSQVIYNQNKKIQHRLTWMVVGSYVRLALLLAPIIVGLIYLPPLIIEFLRNYGSAFGIDSNTFSQFGDVLKNLQSGQQVPVDPGQVQELIKQYGIQQ